MSANTASKLSLASLNELSSEEFIRRLGGIFEHSPWIAEATHPRRPFSRLEELHRTMTAIVDASPLETRLALIRAHPDLAGRLAQQGQLTRESTHEQASAGLNQISSATQTRLTELNQVYRDRFGFPFVICARLNNVGTILAAMENRLRNEPPAEIETAISEIGKIARLRLQDLITD